MASGLSQMNKEKRNSHLEYFIHYQQPAGIYEIIIRSGSYCPFVFFGKCISDVLLRCLQVHLKIHYSERGRSRIRPVINVGKLPLGAVTLQD